MRAIHPFSASGSLRLLLAGLAFVALAGAKPIDPAHFDRAVAPCDDFYRFANGTWMANNPIPADRSAWGSFNEVQDRNQAILHDILEAAAADKSAAANTPRGKVAIFYRAGMDAAKIEKDGLSPLKADFDRIAAIDGPDTLAPVVARFQRHNVPCEVGVRCLFQPTFQVRVAPDAKDSTRLMVNLYQAGLGLPERDYYLKDDDKTKEIRAKYEAHLAKVFGLLGDAPDKAAAEAKTVLAFETRLARASMGNVDLRDPNKVYNKMSLAELGKAAPGFPWAIYFKALGAPDPGPINVSQPDFFKELGAMATGVPVDEWKTYLRWQLVLGASPYLPQAFVDERFAFYDRTFQGATEAPPRWKRILQQTDRSLGEALGELFVQKAFPPEAKARTLAMVENLKVALNDNLAHLDWVSEATRKAAQAKLAAIKVKIGYPDKWRDYSKLTLDGAQPYLANVYAAGQFEFDRLLSRVGQAPDRGEWTMSPPTVNAYYSSSLNEIVFPAGILQPPFFYADADDAVNYGGIGAVIGHEITHGFDDRGRQFDAEGNLRSWWTPEDEKKFTERAAVVGQQFDSYTVLDGLHINGKLTMGENIADLGGVKLALAAYRRSLAGKPAPAPIDGYSGEQRFFLAYAQVWRQNTRDEALRLRIATDPHSPGRFRVLGPLSNTPDFARAFECQPGSGFVRSEAERARIW